MGTEEQSNTSAKMLYRPLGLTSSLLAGLAAGAVFKSVWKHATPGDNADAPKALESEYRLREIIVAFLVQGAISSSPPSRHWSTAAGHACSRSGPASGPVTESPRHAEAEGILRALRRRQSRS